MDFMRVKILMLRPESAKAAQADFPVDVMVSSFGMDRTAGLICETMSNWVIEMSRNQSGLCPVKWAYRGVQLEGTKLTVALARYHQYGPRSPQMFVPLKVDFLAPWGTPDE